MSPMQRRDWLKTTAFGATLVLPFGNDLWANDEPKKKLPIAAVVTTYGPNSHADVIVGKVLAGFRQDGGPGPDLKVVSMYADQMPKNDLSRALADRHGFRICKTIDEAITLGTGQVQVAGVLSIGEHGDYPLTENTKQKMYPRRRLFDAITKSFRKAGSVVPVFNDKHLSYNFADAKHMYDTAREMGIPLMAGSSVPVTWRRPAVALPMGCEIEAVIGVGYGGLEPYGFHAIEGLQCMIERRKGGESGVSSVQAVRGEAVWKAHREGRWSKELLEAALAIMPKTREGKLEDKLRPDAPFYLFEHRDGLRSGVAMANGVARHFGFAAKLKGQAEPIAVWFELEEEKPYGHFAYLLQAIDQMIQTGKPSYPVERTLLTTGLIDSAMQSIAEDGKKLATPHLKIAYQPSDWPFANAKTNAKKN
ncbi:MAG: hypothetical protein ACI9G1_003861 [Pirellulaceae bacterium]|jgi:hypothetical protein